MSKHKEGDLDDSSYQRNMIYEILEKAGIVKYRAIVMKSWFENHRYYHGPKHLIKIIDNINADVDRLKYSAHQHWVLMLAAIFHDIVYNPREYGGENERNSAKLAEKIMRGEGASDKNGTTHGEVISDEIIAEVVDIILFTTYDSPNIPGTAMQEKFMYYDIYDMVHGDMATLLENDRMIFKEFGHVDYTIYRENRSKVLEKFTPAVKRFASALEFDDISTYNEYIEAVKTLRPRIAVYPGTFNPMHVGHLNIIKKAERIFDKVIVCFALNPDKQLSTVTDLHIMDLIDGPLCNTQIDVFDGLLTDYIKSKDYPLTIIKGLRNGADLESEKTQLRYMEDMVEDNGEPKINICYILADREFEHVSSSGIRAIKKIKAAKSDRYEII